MTPRQALGFVREHGVVLESAIGPVPSLAAAIAGEPIRGSWWSHPASPQIFELTRMVRDSPDVLVPKWVPVEVSAEASRLSEDEAVRHLGRWCS